MDNVRHIMVVDSSSEAPSNLAFLLKLAGFRVSEFNDEMEACNWLQQQEAVQRPADMLLLVDPRAERTLFALLFQIRQLNPGLELLLAAPQPLELAGQICQLEPPVRQCAASDVHTLTRQIFRDEEVFRNQRPHAQSNSAGPDRQALSLPRAELEE